MSCTEKFHEAINDSRVSTLHVKILKRKLDKPVLCYNLSFACFSCPPRLFLPALCRVFLDESAPENVLEVTARAITYYLDVSAECTRRIVSVDGAVKMLCNRLVAVDLESRTSKDLAEQCVKVCLFDSFV